MKAIQNVLLVFLILIAFLNCSLPNQPGPMPKDIIDTDFEPGLNIMGILRLNENNSESFVYVEEIIPSDIYGEAELFPIIKNADVTVRGIKDNSLYTFTIDETIDSIRYLNNYFIPLEGESYELTVSAQTEYEAPEIEGQTTIPKIPEIDTLTMMMNATALSFNLLTSPDVYQYQLSLFFQGEEISKTLIINSNISLPVRFDYPESYGFPLTLSIYAYDENLTRYLTASSSIIPQTFQETLSTVEGGYGCFGAISIKNYDLLK